MTQSRSLEPGRGATASRAHADQALERKIERSIWMLFLERLWPRFWLVLAVAGAFVGFSMVGAWAMLGPIAHKVLLASFAIAFLAALIWAARTPWPTRDQGLKRLENLSGLPHRPASSYDDTLSAGDADPATRAVWRAHRRRLAALLDRLRVAGPRPDTPRQDPWALRAALLIGVVALTALAGGQWRDRLAGAFHFAEPATLASRLRIDAWVTPPPYTGKAPVMLADGGRRGAAASQDIMGRGLVDVPQNSQLIVRASGEGLAKSALRSRAPASKSPR